MLALTVDQRSSRIVSHASPAFPPRRRRARSEPYAAAGIEPAIEDILSDPLTWAVMRRDGVSDETLRTLIRDIRASLRARTAVS